MKRLTLTIDFENNEYLLDTLHDVGLDLTHGYTGDDRIEGDSRFSYSVEEVKLEIAVHLPKVKPAEILSGNLERRLVRLSFHDTGHLYGLQEQCAALGAGGVELHYLRSQKKPKFFILSDQEMDTLCEAWQQWRHDYFEHVAREQAESEAELRVLLASCVARAEKYDIVIGASIGPDPVYSLTFPRDSLWAHFWTCNSDLSLSGIEFRLDFIETRDEAFLGALEISNMMARREAE